MPYWIVTGLFAIAFFAGGCAHFFQVEPMLESMTALGYPPYFMRIIGLAKILGAIAVLAPGFPLLKEWAYAGFAFNLLGAIATHLFVGDPLGELFGPVVLLALGAVSYGLRPADRRMPGTPAIGAASARGGVSTT